MEPAHFASYEIPEKLKRWRQLEKEAEKEGRYLGNDIGVFLTRDDIRYTSTPPDVIPFASAGVDGIHYGFVTDFGRVQNLADAYIAAIFPMDFGCEIQLLAKNLDDFLAMLCTDDSLLYNSFPYLDRLASYLETKGEPSWDKEALRAREHFQSVMGVQVISDLVGYIGNLRSERVKSSVLPTLNGMGVVPLSVDADPEAVRAVVSPFPYQLSKEMDWRELYPEIKSFFSQASVEARLAFLRDAQTIQWLDEREPLEWAVRQLRDMGFPAEAGRLMDGYMTAYGHCGISEGSDRTISVTETISVLWWSDSADDESPDSK
ncbi:hypothetical protein [Paenibacillus senegalensis]|uniref:hypothetical protein n=1 Tax=Paenibacillus senegalensis TaxID=1465766 RepID=UPI00028A3926|nr:hypothetical protein [Paenibacillus senegalensis]